MVICSFILYIVWIRYNGVFYNIVEIFNRVIIDKICENVLVFIKNIIIMII